MVRRLKSLIYTLRNSKFVRDTVTLQAGKISLLVVNMASFVVVLRLLGPEGYGTYQLVLAMHAMLMTINIAGLAPSTIIQLAEAVGAQDRTLIRNLMGFFLQISLVIALVMTLIAVLFGPLLAEASYQNDSIGRLLRVYTLTLFLAPVYTLSLIVLQSVRAMRSYSLLENGGNLAEAGLKILAVVLGGGVAGLIVAHVFSAAIKMLGGLYAYRRELHRRPALLPGPGEVLVAARRNSPRPYWRFGVSLALDKNVSAWYILLPVQLVGMWAGEAAVAYLKLGLNVFQYSDLLFKGILTNLETRLPADVGKRDYARLRDNVRRVLLWMIPVSVGLYAALAMFAPLMPLVLGDEYSPAVVVIQILCVYGVAVGLGGLFGPLYRTLRVVRSMIVMRLVILTIAVLPGLWLIRTYGANGGAWVVNLVYALNLTFTLLIVWPRLSRLAGRGAPDPGLTNG